MFMCLGRNENLFTIKKILSEIFHKISSSRAKGKKQTEKIVRGKGKRTTNCCIIFRPGRGGGSEMSPNRTDSTCRSKSCNRKAYLKEAKKIVRGWTEERRPTFHRLGDRCWIARRFLLPSVLAIRRPHRTDYRLGSCSWVPSRESRG